MNDAEILCQDIEEIFYEIFPESHIDAYFETKLGNDICIQYTLGKDKSEYAFGIEHNDPLYGAIFIWDLRKDGSLPEILTVDSDGLSLGGLKPEDSYRASSRIKYFRKFSGSPEKVLLGFEKLWNKLYDLVKENYEADNFNPLPFDVADKL
jgi:hypothetical protein